MPTIAPVGNLLGCGRFPDEEVQKNLKGQIERVSKAVAKGALIGLGSDAGAYLVPHGKGTWDEYEYLKRAGVTEDMMGKTEEKIRKIFRR